MSRNIRARDKREDITDGNVLLENKKTIYRASFLEELYNKNHPNDLFVDSETGVNCKMTFDLSDRDYKVFCCRKVLKDENGKYKPYSVDNIEFRPCYLNRGRTTD
jgi:hypothetical protein